MDTTTQEGTMIASSARDLQRIPAGRGPYAARLIDDEYAVNYMYSLADDRFYTTLSARERDENGRFLGDRFLVRGTTTFRTLPDDPTLRDHAWEVIVDFTG